MRSIMPKLLPALAAVCAAMAPGAICAAEGTGAAVTGNAELDRTSRMTMAVLDRHAAAAGTADVELVVSDYSDDTILITNLVPQPVVGKEALRKFAVDFFKNAPIGKSNAAPRYLRKEAVGEYGYLLVDAGSATVTETYVIRNGKILFESATVMPKTSPAQ
ncbi:MAG: hypothetical protein QM605_00705 [Sphingobium sp.]